LAAVDGDVATVEADVAAVEQRGGQLLAGARTGGRGGVVTKTACIDARVGDVGGVVVVAGVVVFVSDVL
jgi:hypothetical protein